MTTTRIASVQLALRRSSGLDDLVDRVAHFARSAADYGCDFVCFPEHLTLQILGADDVLLDADEAIERLTDITDGYRDALSFLARKHRINIVGGSHAARDDDGAVRNTAWFAHRNGSVEGQAKLHPTPDERDVWSIEGGSNLDIIESDHGPIGITICYDSEFPELGRKLADDGAQIVFVPYMTDTENGHWRVTHCCQARTVENQCYVVTSGITGTIENVTNCEMAYAQSRIMTPCDTGFARGGIAVEAAANTEQMIFADLDLDALSRAREGGAVLNLADRRRDLYSVRWIT